MNRNQSDKDLEYITRMISNVGNASLMRIGCEYIKAQAGIDEQRRQELMSKGAGIVITKGMKAHQFNAEVQARGCGAVMNLALNHEIKIILIEIGAYEAIMNAMNSHVNDVDVQCNGCGALWNLALNYDNKMSLVNMGAGTLIVNAMNIHRENADVQYYGYGALWHLTLDDTNKLILANTGAVHVIISSIGYFRMNSDLVLRGSEVFKQLLSTKETLSVALAKGLQSIISELIQVLVIINHSNPSSSLQLSLENITEVNRRLDLIQNQNMQLANQLIESQRITLGDDEVLKLFAKTENFERMLFQFENAHDRVTIQKFQHLLGDLIRHCGKINELDGELLENGMNMSKSILKQKGTERDAKREKTVRFFNELEKLMDTWLAKALIFIDSNEWQRFPSILQQINHYLAINGINFASQQIVITKGKVEELMHRRMLIEQEILGIREEARKWASLFQNQAHKHNLRYKIRDFERSVKKNQDEILLLKKKSLESQTESLIFDNELSRKATLIKYLEVEQIEKSINALKMENEDLIDQFRSNLVDQDGTFPFPDLAILYLVETDYQRLTHSNNLINIPETLKVKPNRCIMLDMIGNGGFSSVYKMKIIRNGIQLNDTLAFKQLNTPRNILENLEIKMIEGEIEMLEHLKHDNIVKIIGAIGDPNAKDINNKLMGIGIVMEYCENGSLRSLLNSHANFMDMDLIIHWLFGAAQGLEYLHNHTPHAIIHGDIKSDNILIDKEYNAKLCDFGISKLQQSTMASTRVGGGTLVYKAPETFNGKIDRASDVYSFGCVILEMLTGERPWNGLSEPEIVNKLFYTKQQHNLSKVRTDAKQELSDLMKRCLVYDKDKRPSMKQVRMELEKMMSNAVLITLDNKSEEFNKVENLFFPGGDKEGSLNREKYRIVKIDKIRHPFAERRYDAELSNIKSILNNNDANEKLLFHGTKQTDPMDILNHPDAFMKDYSSPGFYGKGLYFAELARYSNTIYRYDITNTNQYQMLVCSVICGNPKEYGIKTSREVSQKDLGTEYHSVHAGPHRPSEARQGSDDSLMYVVYKDTQVLPKYLITYESNQ